MLEDEKADARLCVILPDPKEIPLKREVPLSQAAAMQILLTWEQEQYQPGMKWNGWTDESIGEAARATENDNAAYKISGIQ